MKSSSLGLVPLAIDVGKTLTDDASSQEGQVWRKNTTTIKNGTSATVILKG